MIGIYQLDQDLMLPDRKAVDDDRISAGIGPVPGRIIDRHVDVADPGKHGKCRWPEYRYDVQVLCMILNKHNARDSGSARGESMRIFAGGSFWRG